MSNQGHNNPPITLELPPELATFLIDNCTKNISFSLDMLMKAQMAGMTGGENPLDKKTITKLVGLMEQFKQLRQLTLDAGGVASPEEGD